jgi:hypothetical protein
MKVVCVFVEIFLKLLPKIQYIENAKIYWKQIGHVLLRRQEMWADERITHERGDCGQVTAAKRLGIRQVC